MNKDEVILQENQASVQANDKKVYDKSEVGNVQEATQKEPENIIQPETSNELVANPYAVDLLGLQMNQNQLVALIHRSNSNHLDALNALNVIEYDEEIWEERMLIVPQHIGSKVMIYQL